MGFGETLKAKRAEAALTQSELADLSGVPVGTIRDYEQGKRDPLLSTAKKLAQALHLSIDVLADCVEAAPPIEEPPQTKGRQKKAVPIDQAAAGESTVKAKRQKEK